MAGKRIIAPHESLAFQIIGWAMAVHRQLGPELPEKVYERSVD